MNPIIIYYSKTGFSQRYAAWLAEALNCPCIPYTSRSHTDYTPYDTIIYGGGFRAGTINGIKWFRRQMPHWKEKKLIVFATGAMPFGAPVIADSLRQNFTPEEFEKVKSFYLPGGLDYEKMGPGDRLMVKAFCKMLAAKKDPTGVERAMAESIRHSHDDSGPEYLKPLLEYLT